MTHVPVPRQIQTRRRHVPGCNHVAAAGRPIGATARLAIAAGAPAAGRRAATACPSAGVPAIACSSAGVPATARSSAGVPATARSSAGVPAAIARSSAGVPAAACPSAGAPATACPISPFRMRPHEDVVILGAQLWYKTIIESGESLTKYGLGKPLSYHAESGTFLSGHDRVVRLRSRKRAARE